ncbi:lysoplasmalogenase [Tenacibaculum jejuense]|uniref:lysoplasmalogenase n=1 Tax=Tenacibaculum jejuense TaxID=584609 RepID=UPI0012FE11A7|nr:lysoplasmalogenase [Tenacibaculum jejuense]
MVSIIEIYAVIYNKNELDFIFKPLITSTLVALYLVSVTKPNFWYVSALFFSFWGDVLLLFPEDFFVLGLLSFLITHVIYIKIISGFIKKIKLGTKMFSFLAFLIYFSAIIFLIQNNLKELFFPVIMYGIVISLFGTTALLNYINNKTTESLWLFIGALIFILSDTILALHKFYSPQPIFLNSIMITYIVAQFYICKGMISKGNLEV